MTSVLIPTSGRSTLLQRTLDSLCQCTLPDGYRELVVVENGPDGEARQAVEDLPGRLNARYLYREEANKSLALNRALETMGEDLIIFSDDDVRFSERLLTAYAASGREHGPGHFFGGPVRVDLQKEPPAWMEELLPLSARGADLVRVRPPVGYLGCNWAAFGADLRRAGGFNPDLGPGAPSGASGQENEMQQRLLDEGCRPVDVMEAVLWHYVPAKRCSEEWLERRYFNYGVSLGLARERPAGRLRLLTQAMKYTLRWGVYLLLFNKTERKRSKLELITRIAQIRTAFGTLPQETSPQTAHRP